MSDAFVVRKGGAGSAIKNAKLTSGYALEKDLDPNLFVDYAYAKPEERLFTAIPYTSNTNPNEFQIQNYVLDAERTLFIYCNFTGDKNTSYPYAVIIKKGSNGSVTVGTPIQLGDVSIDYRVGVYLYPYGDNEDFIVTYGGSAGNKPYKQRVLRVEGMLISLGEVLEHTDYTAAYMIGYENFHMDFINSNVFITIRSGMEGSTTNIYAELMRVDDMTISFITVKSDNGTVQRVITRLTYSANSYGQHAYAQISARYYMIMFTHQGGYPCIVLGVMVNEDLNAIEVSDELTISNGESSTEYYRSLIPIGNRKIIATYAGGASSSAYFLKATLLEINLLTIKKGLTIQLTSEAYANPIENNRYPIVKKLSEHDFALIASTSTYPVATFAFTYIEPEFFASWSVGPYMFNNSFFERPSIARDYKLGFTSPYTSLFTQLRGRIDLNDYTIVIPSTASFYPNGSNTGSVDSMLIYGLTTISYDPVKKSVSATNVALNPIKGYTQSLSNQITITEGTDKDIKEMIIVYGLKTLPGTTGADRALTYYHSNLNEESLKTPFFKDSLDTSLIEGVTKTLLSKNIKGKVYTL